MVVLSKRARNLHQGAIRAMFDKAATMDRVISMGIGEPDMATPMPICEAAAMALRNGQTHYTPNAGTLECRQAVSEWGNIKELHYDPRSEIIITPGGMGALSLLLSSSMAELCQSGSFLRRRSLSGPYIGRKRLCDSGCRHRAKNYRENESNYVKFTE